MPATTMSVYEDGVVVLDGAVAAHSKLPNLARDFAQNLPKQIHTCRCGCYG
jgi:hypothetical protein